MNILITGASGAVAHYLIDYLQRTQPEAPLCGISRTPPRTIARERLVHHFCVDMAFDVVPTIQKIIDDVKPDIVFHLASMANVRDSFDRPAYYLDNNIQSTAKLYEAIRRSKSRPTVMLASTSEVYGAAKESDNPIKETQVFAPINPYAISKVVQEYIANVYSYYEVPTVITRAFGYINPLREDLVATSVAKQIVNSENGVVRVGNLKPVRTFCDVRDIVEAYWLAATRGRPGDAYNIGSEAGIKVKDLVYALCDMADRKIVLSQDKNLFRPTDIAVCVPDCSKFKAATGTIASPTGWEPKIPINESLSWLMESARNAR